MTLSSPDYNNRISEQSFSVTHPANSVHQPLDGVVHKTCTNETVSYETITDICCPARSLPTRFC